MHLSVPTGLDEIAVLVAILALIKTFLASPKVRAEVQAIEAKYQPTIRELEIAAKWAIQSALRADPGLASALPTLENTAVDLLSQRFHISQSLIRMAVSAIIGEASSVMAMQRAVQAVAPAPTAVQPATPAPAPASVTPVAAAATPEPAPEAAPSQDGVQSPLA